MVLRLDLCSHPNHTDTSQFTSNKQGAYDTRTLADNKVNTVGNQLCKQGFAGMGRKKRFRYAPRLCRVFSIPDPGLCHALDPCSDGKRTKPPSMSPHIHSKYQASNRLVGLYNYSVALMPLSPHQVCIYRGTFRHVITFLGGAQSGNLDHTCTTNTPR